jgi:hypothetical protein
MRLADRQAVPSPLLEPPGEQPDLRARHRGRTPLELARRERRHVLLRQRGPQPFLADAPDVAATSPLRVEQDPEVNARLLQRPRERLRRQLAPRVERGVVADEPQELDRVAASVLDLESELARPASSLPPGPPERVAGRFDRLERRGESWIQLALLDERTPKLTDDRDVLDPDRADLDAGHALRARPHRFRRDPAADQRVVRARERRDAEPGPNPERSLRELPKIQDEVTRRERVSAAVAGQTTWHLPHLVHASSERRCFRDRSVMRP